MPRLTIIALAAMFALGAPVFAAETGAALAATAGLRPNLEGQMDQPLRYRPDGEDFVIENGAEFFNRSLYGGNTAFRVDGGDKPEFLMYLPGRGGNLRLGVRTSGGAIWLHTAAAITSRYRPGELLYEIRDPRFGKDAVIRLEVLAYNRTEGLVLKAQGSALPAGAELFWAYGGVNGKRGTRDGDIGTEKVPISEYFQFAPALADDNAIALAADGFSLTGKPGTIAGVVPAGAVQSVAPGALWNDPQGMLASQTKSAASPVVVGRVALREGQPLYLSLQRTALAQKPAADLDVYKDVTTVKKPIAEARAPAPLLATFAQAEIAHEFEAARAAAAGLRTRVSIDTPDPYLNAAMGALNVVGDALWDEQAQAIMHGSIAWRTKLLGWRGPYALDALGWHDRARANIGTWIPRQNTEPTGAIPPADESANLARNEPGLHSNGDISNSHYDMNMVFIDALLRHLLWTGDRQYAKQVWPVLERHLAWEKRLFRREYGADKLPLYEAYAAIWASDDLYYNGGGTSYASAYNLYANQMAARLAPLAGKDPAPYAREAALIAKGLERHLWMPERGAFAEYKDLLGGQLLHPDYALWSFYHTIDEGGASARQAWAMGNALARDFKAIPVRGAGVPADRAYRVYSETRWMPYTWSINNVVGDENMHTALALWQAGHAEQAFTLAKGALLANMFMGISPGNVGTMTLFDAYRRESQRDFGDGAGVMSRAFVEGLFGIRPDALAGVLTVSPGFPAEWQHASIKHPDLNVAMRRTGLQEAWEIGLATPRFKQVELRLPAAYERVAAVTLNGKPLAWRAERDAVGRPLLLVRAPLTGNAAVRITWAGNPIKPVVKRGSGEFVRVSQGDFDWWVQAEKAPAPAAPLEKAFDWSVPLTSGRRETIALTPYFNDRVGEIFKLGKYRSPRSPHVSLALPAQGIGAWAGHVNHMATIDDSGLRRQAAANGDRLRMPNGVEFATPGAGQAANIVFTSQWDNYPRESAIPLGGKASRAYLLMAGSTNHMQSRIDNGEVVVAYADGSSARLALHNPTTWWPIEQDYFIDDYQFPLAGALPPRVDLKTGAVRLLDAQGFKGKGKAVDGGAATVLSLALDPSKSLKSLTVRTLANDVVIGLMGVTLERP
ncbi:MAG: DUF4450 domain-containing protein [Massilia sp.]